MTEITEITDHMQYQEGMEVLDSDMLNVVLDSVKGFDPTRYTAKEVRAALRKDVLSPEDYAALLSFTPPLACLTVPPGEKGMRARSAQNRLKGP